MRKKIFILLALCYFLSSSGVHLLNSTLNAATEGEVTVGAVVANDTAPSVPQLVSPGNGGTINTTQPNITWMASSDSAHGVHHYEFFLDGSSIYGNISTSAEDNASYALTYNPITTEYTLFPKSQIPFGSHTWKIRAFNNNLISADSDTWTFTIAPAPTATPTPTPDPTDDPNTSPTPAPTQTPLPSPTPPFLVIPTPTPLTSPSIPPITALEPATPATESSTTPTSNGPTPTATPTPRSPLQEVTSGVNSALTNIQNTIGQARTQTLELLQNTLNALPEPIANTIEVTAQLTQRGVLPAAAITVVTASTPIQAFFTLLSQTGSQFSPDFLVKIIQAIGLIPAGKPKGYVFSSKTKEPVPFALLTVKGTEFLTGKVIQETLVTNVYGFYKGISLPRGEYQIEVKHQKYIFPSRQQRPAYLLPEEFYLGEKYSTSDTKDKKFHLIPLDPLIEEKARFSLFNQLRLGLFVVNRTLKYLTFPLFVISIIVVFLLPAPINWAILGVYGIVSVSNVLPLLKPANVVGVVSDMQNQPISNALVRVSDSNNSEVVALIITDVDGKYRFSLKPGKYYISVSKDNYTSAIDSLSFSSAELHVTKQKQSLVHILKPTSYTEAEIFG